MQIVDIELRKVFDRLRERGKNMVLTDEARGFIIDKGEAGDGLDYGARPLRRSVEKYIEDPLSEEILRGTFDGQNTIKVVVREVGDQKLLGFEGSLVENVTTEDTAAVTAG
ncbi:MAG UNVERIFIED_CONTAM: hypothetical protein LVR18_37040 [Planctomycetaceae bacterium]|jgi:ATP-dependent Clp protease ATP-binding subunit ClpC